MNIVFRNVWTVDGKISYKVDDTPDSEHAAHGQYKNSQVTAQVSVS